MTLILTNVHLCHSFEGSTLQMKFSPDLGDIHGYEMPFVHGETLEETLVRIERLRDGLYEMKRRSEKKEAQP